MVAFSGVLCCGAVGFFRPIRPSHGVRCLKYRCVCLVCAGEDVGSPRPTVSGPVSLQAEREEGEWGVSYTCNQRFVSSTGLCLCEREKGRGKTVLLLIASLYVERSQ